ncbi:hypothetical protein VPH35_082781 [Triticum aestivum]
MIRRPNSAAAPISLTVADDRVPPQTAAMMERATQLLTDGLTGFPLLGASPSPRVRSCIGLEGPHCCRRRGSPAWPFRLGDRAAGPVVRSCRGLARAGRDLSRRRWFSRSLGACFGFGTIPISLSLPPPRCGRARLYQIRRALVAGSLNHRPGGHRVSSTPLQRHQLPPLHWLRFGYGVG